MGKWENGEMGEWGNGEMEEWGNGRMGEWGNGEMGKWENVCSIYSFRFGLLLQLKCLVYIQSQLSV